MTLNTVRSLFRNKPSLALIWIIGVCPALVSCADSEPSWYVQLEEARHLCASGKLDESKSVLQKTEQATIKTGRCPSPYLLAGQSGRTPVTYTGELAALADCYAFHGRSAEAQTILTEAVELSKKDPQNSNELAPTRALASIYEREKKYALSEPLRLRILSSPHASLEDSYRLGDLYLAENKLKDAASIYGKAMALEEKQQVRSAQLSDHLNKLGRCYFLQGNLSEAEKLYKRALEYDPLAHESDRGDSFNAKDLRPMAQLYLAKGDLTRSEAFYRQCLSGALEYTPAEQAQILTDYAKLLRTMKQESQAEIREGQARNKSLEATAMPLEYVPRSYE